MNKRIIDIVGKFDVLALTFITLLLYANGIFNDFVEYDDYIFFHENEAFLEGTLEAFVSFIKKPFQGHYQPVTWLCFFVVKKLFGLNAMAFKMMSIVAHLTCGILVLRILKKLLSNSLTSFMLSVLFIVAPLHSEAVLQASGFGTLLSAMLGLISFHFFLKFERKNHRSQIALSALFYILAVLAKSSMVLLPLLFVVRFQWPQKAIFPSQNRIVLQAVFLTLVSCFAVLTYLSVNSFDAVNNTLMTEMSALKRLALIPVLLLYYPFKLIIPIHFSTPYFIPFQNNTAVFVLMSIVALMIICIFTYAFLKSKKPWHKGIIFYIVMMLPLIQIIPFGDNPINDRYGYFSILGILMAIGIAIEYTQQIRYPKFLVLAVSCLILFSMYQTAHRISAWQNSITLYEDCRSKWPNHPYPYYALAVIQTNNSENTKALKYFKKAKELGIKNATSLYYESLNHIALENYKSAAL
ncbi:MAG: hypothetical protein MRY83_05180, partial [Flavobacteriales bacterium]|nr:hypothetical protein [Flavobacteriales bacterium]